MLGAVFATLYAAPTPWTPRTAARAAVRRKPVPRDAIVPTAIVRVERPRSLIAGSRVGATQGAAGDPDPGRNEQDARADAGDSDRDLAVLRAADDELDLLAEVVAVVVDELRGDREAAGGLRRHLQVDLRRGFGAQGGHRRALGREPGPVAR